MSDKDDKDFDINEQEIVPEDSGSDKPENKDFSPFGGPEESSDEMPAVSMTKKKNAVVFFVGFGVVMFLVYSMLNSGKPKNLVKTEAQQMSEENRQKSAVPAGNPDKSQGDISNSVSASAATPGGGEDNVPTLPMMEKKTNQYSLQQTLPPPPTLPPVFDPASIYVSGGSGGPDYDSAPAANAFGDRYTKKRSKIPSYSSDVVGEDAISDLDPESQKKLQEERQRRIGASMFVGGSSSGNLFGNDDAASKDAADGAEDGFVLSESSADKTDVTIRKDLNSVILQGKVIDAVIETAINTDLPGKLRGIVSRDIYSESGKRVVIPKGSRLIGSYATDVKFGQARVYVIWSRVIRPDGVDAVLDGNDDLVAIDALGRSGVYGELDNRFFEIFGSSILLSSLTVAFAVAADAAAGGDSANSSTTTSSATGSTTTTNSSAVSEGVKQAVSDLGSTTKDIIKQNFKTTPRITIDQGTKIKIFVNKDIIFPPAYLSSGMPKTGTQILN